MKKFLVFILLLSLVINLPVSVLASENSNEQYKLLSEITNDELSTFALNFAKDFEPNLNLEVGEIIPVYNESDALIGFSISYVLDNNPYGYINLDFTKENHVSDFSIFKGENSIYNILAIDINKQNSFRTIEKKLYSFGGLQYAIPFDENGETVFHFSDGENIKFNINTNNKAGVKYNSHSELFSKTYRYGALLNTEAYTSKYNKSKSLISESYIESTTNKYACSVLALTEIANQENILKNSNIVNTFNQLWKDTDTTVINVKNGISYGSTLDSKLGSSMTTYAKSMGKNNTTVTTKSNPDFEFFKNIINNNASGIFKYAIDLTDGSGSGHAVNMIGYCVVRLNGVFYNYLVVADGWHNDAPRYFNFSETDFRDSYGVKFIIK